MVDIMEQGMTYIPIILEDVGMRFHHSNENDVVFRTYELFIFKFPFNIFGS
jgi:hypothetical protein